MSLIKETHLCCLSHDKLPFIPFHFIFFTCCLAEQRYGTPCTRLDSVQFGRELHGAVPPPPNKTAHWIQIQRIISFHCLKFSETESTVRKSEPLILDQRQFGRDCTVQFPPKLQWIRREEQIGRDRGTHIIKKMTTQRFLFNVFFASHVMPYYFNFLTVAWKYNLK